MSIPGGLKPFLKITRDSLEDLRDSVKVLVENEVLVGFPEDTTTRKDDPEDREITNAALGYIHNTGMPEQNIPAREFMESGIRDGQDKITAQLARTAKITLTKRSPVATQQGLERVGLTAQAALRRKINEGIPPPLADATLRERARRGRKGAKIELQRRGDGEAPSTQFAKPLIDTGQLRNAINYVIRKRKV